MRETMSVMTNLLSCPTSLPGKEGTRKTVESLWGLYLVWRSRHSQAAEGACAPERPSSGFLLLREIETTALAVLKLYLSEEIPCEFGVALMKSTADATDRFMRANPADADRYRRLGFEMFWNGLVTVGISKRKKAVGRPQGEPCRLAHTRAMIRR